MANRETFPASQSPLQGDISAPAGATVVTVVGIQGTPVDSSTPIDQQSLTFFADSGMWEPTTPGNISMMFEGVSISDDYDIYCNGISLECLVDWPYGFASQIFVEGSPVA